MVRSGSKRNFRLASICKEEVINGGCGRCVRGVEVTEVTARRSPTNAVARAWAASSLKTVRGALDSRAPRASKFLPVASAAPLRVSTVASKVVSLARSVAVTSNQVAERKAMRSRSRSQTRRIATDCTRPAERALSTARQSTGETS